MAKEKNKWSVLVYAALKIRGSLIVQEFLESGETNSSERRSQPVEIIYTYSWLKYLPMKIKESVPKRRHIKFRPRGITQKKT
jgi:hypothetical protein